MSWGIDRCRKEFSMAIRYLHDLKIDVDAAMKTLSGDIAELRKVSAMLVPRGIRLSGLRSNLDGLHDRIESDLDFIFKEQSYFNEYKAKTLPLRRKTATSALERADLLKHEVEVVVAYLQRILEGLEHEKSLRLAWNSIVSWFVWAVSFPHLASSKIRDREWRDIATFVFFIIVTSLAFLGFTKYHDIVEWWESRNPKGIDTSQSPDITLDEHLSRFQWARSWGGPNDDVAIAMAIDVSNNIHAVGASKGTLTVKDDSMYWPLSTCNTDLDIVLVNFEADGRIYLPTLVNFGDVSRVDLPSDINAGYLGDLYISARYLESGMSIDPMQILSPMFDICWGSVVYKPSENWTVANPNDRKMLHYTYSQEACLSMLASALGPDENLYVTGSRRSSSASSETEFEGFVHVKDTDLAQQEIHELFSQAEYTYFTDIAVSKMGNIYLTGSVGHNQDLGIGENAAVVLRVPKIDLDSESGKDKDVVWEVFWGQDSYGEGIAIAIDDHVGHESLYVAGHFAGKTSLEVKGEVLEFESHGDWDILLCKIDESGEILWVAPPIGEASKDEVRGICVDKDGCVYITGYVDKQTGVVMGQQAFVEKYSSAGDFLGRTFWGDKDNPAQGCDVEVDESGNLYLLGIFQGMIDLDPVQTTADFHESQGGWDIFLAKFEATKFGE